MSTTYRNSFQFEEIELWAEGRLEETNAVPTGGLEALLARAGVRGDVASFELERQSAELRHQAVSRRVIPEPSLTVGTKKTRAFVSSNWI